LTGIPLFIGGVDETRAVIVTDYRQVGDHIITQKSWESKSFDGFSKFCDG
jgi:hypothetical protein